VILFFGSVLLNFFRSQKAILLNKVNSGPLLFFFTSWRQGWPFFFFILRSIPSTPPLPGRLLSIFTSLTLLLLVLVNLDCDPSTLFQPRFTLWPVFFRMLPLLPGRPPRFRFSPHFFTLLVSGPPYGAFSVFFSPTPPPYSWPV